MIVSYRARECSHRLTHKAIALVALALHTLPSSELDAQRVVPSVEIGGSRVHYADSVRSSAASITPSVRYDADRATLGAAGTFARFAGGWSGYGGVQGSIYAPVRGMLSGELSGTAGGSAHQGGIRTGQTLGIARAHLTRGTRGGWGGIGGGTTWDGGTWRSIRVAELAGWSSVGATTAVATFTPTSVADTIRFADTQFALRLDLSRTEIGVAAGLRTGARLPVLGTDGPSWGTVSVTGWIGSHVAVVAAGGTYPVDYSQGFPGGRFAWAGVRLGARTSHRGVAGRPQPTRATTVTPLVLRDAPTDERAIDLLLLSSGTGRHTLRVNAPNASTVEISGDFTDWEAVQLASEGGGWWTISLPISSGTHQMNVRLDGGSWKVPRGTTAINDEFGGAVGVLNVP